MKKYVVFMCMSCISTGCATIRAPRTELKAGPFGSFFSFFDSKDNDITIKNAKYDSKTNMFSVKELTVRNNASDVSRAYADQIKAQAEFTKAFAENLRAMAAIVTAALPGVSSNIQVSPITVTEVPEITPLLSIEDEAEIVKEVPK